MPDFLGATYDDVRAQQRAVQALLVSLSAKAPGQAVPMHADDWDALAKSALAFASESVTINPITLNEQFERGKTLLGHLNEWDGVLSGRQPQIPEGQPQGQPRAPYIPYVAPQETPPGGKTFWQQAMEATEGGLGQDLALVLLLYFAFSNRRG